MKLPADDLLLDDIEKCLLSRLSYVAMIIYRFYSTTVSSSRTSDECLDRKWQVLCDCFDNMHYACKLHYTMYCCRLTIKQLLANEVTWIEIKLLYSIQERTQLGQLLVDAHRNLKNKEFDSTLDLPKPQLSCSIKQVYIHIYRYIFPFLSFLWLVW